MGDGSIALVIGKLFDSEISNALDALAVKRVAAGGPSSDGRIVFAILDLTLEVKAGLEALRTYKTPTTEGLNILSVPLVVIVRDGDDAASLRAWNEGAYDVVTAGTSKAELSVRLGRVIAFEQRMHELREENERLRELSATDALTGLSNFRTFNARLSEEFRGAGRYSEPLALAILDLDHFKKVNDTFGHPRGNEVLRAVADALRAAVRETDHLSRYGGEEFAVILPKTHLAGALTVAERIAQGVARIDMRQSHFKLSASFGISGFPGRDVATHQELLRTADDALLQAKREGRNRICIFRALESTRRP